MVIENSFTRHIYSNLLEDTSSLQLLLYYIEEHRAPDRLRVYRNKDGSFCVAMVIHTEGAYTIDVVCDHQSLVRTVATE